MAKKKVEKEEVKELKKYLVKGNVIFGRDKVMKALLAGKVGMVFIANNFPTKKDLFQYTKLNGVKVLELDQNNEELGILCKKNFMVSIVGVLGE